MPDTEYTGETLNLAPILNYHRDIEVVRKFLERLTAMNAGQLHPIFGMDIVTYVDVNLDTVRQAMSGIMADDVERQIKITNDFPLQKQLTFHDFEPDERASDVCAFDSDCFARRDALVHRL